MTRLFTHLLLEKAGAGHAGHVTVSETAQARAELLQFAVRQTFKM